MNAPWPPPTMPRRIRPPALASLLPSIAIPSPPQCLRPSPPHPGPLATTGEESDAQHALDLIGIDLAGGEIVERLFGDLDDVARDEGRAFRRTLLGILDCAFPFEHGPGIVIVGCELREDGAEIDLPVAERAEAAGALDPRLEPRIDPLTAVRIKLGILHVKGLDALVVDVDESEIVELLQQEMGRVVIDAAAPVPVHLFKEDLEGGAIEHVLARMNLEANVHPLRIIGVEDRRPAAAELFECRVDHPGRALRPRVDEGPSERTAEGDM